LDTAARSNYLYLKDPISSQRNHFARQLVQRYIESKDGNVEVALKKIRKTLRFRQDIQIDELITAFDNDDDDGDSDSVGDDAVEHSNVIPTTEMVNHYDDNNDNNYGVDVGENGNKSIMDNYLVETVDNDEDKTRARTEISRYR